MSLERSVDVAVRLHGTGTGPGKALAARLVVDALSLVTQPPAFLPLFDEFLDRGLFPADPKAVVDAALALGIPEMAVLERLDRPLDQLRALILGNLDDVARYRRLAQKIDGIPNDLLRSLAAQCVADGNQAGMAVLLAVALGDAAALGPAPFVADSCGYKGIGGGTNLLRRWFDDRDRLPDDLRARVKLIAKSALQELAFEWIARGGQTGAGLIPQSQARPFSSGDDLDDLDMESTMEAIVSAGKSLDQVTTDDLYVHVTAKGRAAIGVLIDISGSMSGRELAMCSIAVVMLLGRLAPEEVAVALFESDTHVVKGFAEDRDLDEVCDRLLELRATGGTRVDHALQWLGDQFEGIEAEFRLMFLLSDFCFFESRDALRVHAERLSGINVRYLGASHGHTCKGCSELFHEIMSGDVIRLGDLEKLPALLHDTILKIGDRGT